MGRKRSLLTKWTCDLCGKYKEDVQNIADSAEIPRTSFYDAPTGWIEIRRPNHDTLLYCHICRQFIDERIEYTMLHIKKDK